MSGCQYKIQRTGEDVVRLLDKIEELGLATTLVPGMMSPEDKCKLDSMGIYYNTTAYWNRLIGFIPKAGEIIIYSDYDTVVVDGVTRNVPGIKVGSGNGYVQDLAFVSNSDTELLLDHIHDSVVHITQAERDYWNNKLNVNDSQEVVGEQLIFNRN